MTLAIYRTTAAFAKEELFGLTSQMRHAGIAVASNSAEIRPQLKGRVQTIPGALLAA